MRANSKARSLGSTASLRQQREGVHRRIGSSKGSKSSAGAVKFVSMSSSEEIHKTRRRKCIASAIPASQTRRPCKAVRGAHVQSRDASGNLLISDARLSPDVKMNRRREKQGRAGPRSVLLFVLSCRLLSTDAGPFARWPSRSSICAAPKAILSHSYCRIC